jgi:hypothetical protein
MDPNYLSALSGLAGAIIGGLTSFGTTWMTQTTQARERAADTARKLRVQLYVSFTKEASELFAHALSHDDGDLSEVAKLDATIAHIRMVSRPEIIAAAEEVIQAIVNAYASPNRKLLELRDFAANGGLDPLHHFANLCRKELDGFHFLKGPHPQAAI